MAESKNLADLSEEEIQELFQKRIKKLIDSLNSVKDVTQDNILDSLLNDEELRQILLSRKYVFCNGKIYPINPTFISASLVPNIVSNEILKESLLRLDGNYKIDYKKNKEEIIKHGLRKCVNRCGYLLNLPFRLIDDLYDWIIDFLVKHAGLKFTRVAVHDSKELIYKIRSGEEKVINCDDLDIKELLQLYNEFDEELQAIPETFSEALGYHMEQRKMSGAQLSGLTGIAESTISKWLNENKKEVSSHKLKSIVSICIALHLPPVMSYNLIDLAGCRLLNNKKDRIYTMLLNYFYDKDLDYCDQVLEELGVKGLKIY